jgi:ferredoxin-thioredoxin reductase catalytic subunit
MNTEGKEWFNKLKGFCENKNFRLSDKAEKIIEGIIRKNGTCPCRLNPTPCPCEFHEEEIQEKGKCHCGLFIKI